MSSSPTRGCSDRRRRLNIRHHVLPAHRAVDFRGFLNEIDCQTDPGLAIHVICDNISAHKAPVVHKWLLAHPRFKWADPGFVESLKPGL
jgi:hypothetical protein